MYVFYIFNFWLISFNICIYWTNFWLSACLWVYVYIDHVSLLIFMSAPVYICSNLNCFYFLVAVFLRYFCLHSCLVNSTCILVASKVTVCVCSNLMLFFCLLVLSCTCQLHFYLLTPSQGVLSMPEDSMLNVSMGRDQSM